MRSIKKTIIPARVYMTSDIYSTPLLVNKFLRNTNNISAKPIRNGHVYEDRCSKYIHKNFSLFGLYDGHGSTHENQILEYTNKHLLPKIAKKCTTISNPNEIAKQITQSFIDIENECRHIYGKKFKHIGCTATVVFINSQNIITTWVGDSPCYLFTDNGFVKLVNEHSYDNPSEYRRVIHSGSQWIDKRVHGTIMMSRSIGDFEDKDAGGLIALPECKIVKRNKNQKAIFICSDGISDVLNGEIYSNATLTKKKKDENIFRYLQSLRTSTPPNNFIPSIVNMTNNILTSKKSLSKYRDDISCIYIDLTSI